MADDKKIPEVPRLEQVTGNEKLPVSANGQPRHIEASQLLDYIKGEDCVIVDISFLLEDGAIPEYKECDAPEEVRKTLQLALNERKKVYLIASDEYSYYIWTPTFLKTQTPRDNIIMMVTDDMYIHYIYISKDNWCMADARVITYQLQKGGGGVEVKEGDFEVKEMRIVDSEGMDSFVYVLPVTLVSEGEYDYNGHIDPKYLDEMIEAVEKNKTIFIRMRDLWEDLTYRFELPAIFVGSRIDRVNDDEIEVKFLNTYIPFNYRIYQLEISSNGLIGVWQLLGAPK